MEKDEKENGKRKILNFGHTFAHAFEASLNYSNKLNHGEAVILGMKTALNFSLKNNLLKRKDYESIFDHINNFRLVSSLKKFFNFNDIHRIISYMITDKKNNSNKINLVLLRKIGMPIIDKRYDKEKIIKFLKSELND